MVTGPAQGTYIALGNDIAEVAKTADIVLHVKESGGSIDNIKRLAGTDEDLALGIVQSDVLGFLKRSKNPSSVAMSNRLRVVFPLYTEEVHIFARRDIKSIGELSGKRIIVGDEGSGSLVTSINLLSMMNVTPAENTRATPAEAVMTVLKGDADAMVFVGGKPVKLFKNLESLRTSRNAETASLLNNFHFVPLMDETIRKEYATATLTPKDYGWMSENVPTVSVTAMLVSPDFSSPTDAQAKLRCGLLRNLAEALREHIGYLQQSGHPKWAEVNFDAKIGIWKRDICTWPANLIPKLGPSKAPSALEKDILGIIKGEQTR